jgi:hypothetical protein
MAATTWGETVAALDGAVEWPLATVKVSRCTV